MRRRLISVGLILLIIFGLFESNIQASAAAEPKLNITEMNIPIGKMNSSVKYVQFKDNAKIQIPDPYLKVENKKKGATYEFTSSNTKVVKISKKGGYVTALKAGKATITCKQTYKNKTKVIGKCKITVHDSSLTVYPELCTFRGSVGLLGVTYFYDGEYSVHLPFYIEYMKPDAVYTFKTDSEDFTFEEVGLSEDEVLICRKDVLSQFIVRYRANKAGTYKVSVIETYKDKTKTVGSFDIKVQEMKLW